MDETREKLQVVDKRRFTTLDLEDVTPQSAGPFGRKLSTEFSPSSTPSQTPGMDFPMALKQVMKGNRVTRLEWENPNIWLMMSYWGAINEKVPAGKYLTIVHADGSRNPLYVHAGDLLADDWVVVV